MENEVICPETQGCFMAKMKSIPFLLRTITILLQIHFLNIYSKAEISKVLDKQELNVRDFLRHSLKVPLPCNRAFLVSLLPEHSLTLVKGLSKLYLYVVSFILFIL